MTPGDFAALLLACAVGIGVGLVFAQWSMTSYLRLKAEPENRTPAELGGGFFYIVPEHEYVEAWGKRAGEGFKK